MMKDEEECERHFTATHSRRQDGRYIVRLPVREQLSDLQASYQIAVSQLHSMERRFSKDDGLRHHYQAFLTEYAALGHMSQINPLDSSKTRVAYLPHHGVMKQSEDQKKLRN